MAELNQLVTLAEVKGDLNLTGTADDAKLVGLIAAAEATAFGYLDDQDVDDFYTNYGEDGVVQLNRAVRVMVLTMYEDPQADPLCPAFRALTRRFRTPVMA